MSITVASKKAEALSCPRPALMLQVSKRAETDIDRPRGAGKALAEDFGKTPPQMIVCGVRAGEEGERVCLRESLQVIALT